jgi:hypothetical protein
MLPSPAFNLPPSRFRLVSCALRIIIATSLFVVVTRPAPAQIAAWTYGHDAQHSGISTTVANSLGAISWQTPVDLNPQYSGNDLFIHYGSPVITTGNTVIVPVKTGASGGYQVEARSGTNGALLWTQPTNYAFGPLPSGTWTPSYGPTIAGSRLYYPDAGGSVLYRTNLDTPGVVTPTRVSVLPNYTGNQSTYDANIFINTPITSDAAGNVFFGFNVTNPSAVGGLQSGIARIDPTGNVTTVAAATAAGDSNIQKVVQNCAPAVSPDGSTVYVTVRDGNNKGYLLALNSTTLATTGQVNLMDVKNTSNRANLIDSGTASPTVGPNGDVYIGVLESPFSTSHGWLLHYNAALTVAKPAGAFGWDDTASIVPRSMVPQYTQAMSTSPYLIMTKYNNYAGTGGDGVNKLAILDPYLTHVDPASGATVMNEVETIAGVTPDPEYDATLPNAVREWCINAAAIDPFTDSVIANSEDGRLYRWDLATNTFAESITLTTATGEAYTPTLIGPDGTVYAINNAQLFAVVPEPSTLLLTAAGLGAVFAARRRRGAKVKSQ